MIWQNDRKFIIVFLREHPKGEDCTVSMTVKKDMASAFHANLNNFLDFCKDTAKISIESVDDAETKALYKAIIKLKPTGYHYPPETTFQRGNQPEIQMRLVNELRSRVQQFVPLCSEIA